MVTCLMPDKELENFRIRIPREIKEGWDAMCERKKISQQDAGAALMKWLLEMPDLLQSAIMGQVDPMSQRQVLTLLTKIMSPQQPGDDFDVDVGTPITRHPAEDLEPKPTKQPGKRRDSAGRR